MALAIAVHGNATLFTALWLPEAVLLPLLVAAWLHRTLERPVHRYGHEFALALMR